MDIRCPSCTTLYEFDESRIGPEGVNVRCSACGQVFKVKTAAQTSSVTWMVKRLSTGEVIYFDDLTTLQRWIIEQKVTREDKISKTGDSWKPLGTIQELSTFFKVVDELAASEEPTRSISRRAESGGSSRVGLPTSGNSPAVQVSARPGQSGGAQNGSSSSMGGGLAAGAVGGAMASVGGATVGGATQAFSAWNPPARAPEPAQSDADFSIDEKTQPNFDPAKHAKATTSGFEQAADLATRENPQVLKHGQAPNSTGYAIGSDKLTLRDPAWTDSPQAVPLGASLRHESGAIQFNTQDFKTVEKNKTSWWPLVVGALLLLLIVLFFFSPWFNQKPAAPERSASTGGPTGQTYRGPQPLPPSRTPVLTPPSSAATAGSAAAPTGDAPSAVAPTAVVPTAAAPTDLAAAPTGAAPTELAAAPTADATTPTNAAPSALAPAPTTAQTEAEDARARETARVNNEARPPATPVAAPISPTASYEELIDQGNTALRAGQYQNGLNAFLAASDARQNSAEAHVGVARAYDALGRDDLAIVRYQRAARVNSRYTPAWLGLGDAYRRKGDSANAIEAYQRVLTIVRSGSSAERAIEALRELGASPTP